MPFYRRPFERGNLYIKFEIEFPPSNFIPEDKIEVGDYTLYKVFFFFQYISLIETSVHCYSTGFGCIFRVFTTIEVTASSSQNKTKTV